MYKSQLNKSFRDNILRKRIYWICLALITCLSYAFDLVIADNNAHGDSSAT